MTHDAESMPQRARPWRFDNFAEDAILGEATLILDEARLTRWAGLFGQTAPPATAPAGLLVALLMEGYMDAISPRPPGNIHAGQWLRFTSAGIGAGEVLTVTMRCNGRELKNDRRRVRFGAEMCDHDGRIVLEGEMRVIWAA